MANIKKITRDKRLDVLLSKEEDKLIREYAEKIGIKPSKLLRNLAMNKIETDSKIKKEIQSKTIKAYYKYLEITKQTDKIEIYKSE